MNETIFFTLTFPLASLLLAVMVKGILICKEAREEEFAARLQTVANAETNLPRQRRQGLKD